MQRLALARGVFDACFKATESFDPIARDLVYLLGAIIDGQPDSFVDWTITEYPERTQELLEILQKAFPAGDPLWDFIVLDGGPSK